MVPARACTALASTGGLPHQRRQLQPAKRRLRIRPPFPHRHPPPRTMFKHLGAGARVPRAWEGAARGVECLAVLQLLALARVEAVEQADARVVRGVAHRLQLLLLCPSANQSASNNLPFEPLRGFAAGEYKALSNLKTIWRLFRRLVCSLTFSRRPAS